MARIRIVAPSGIVPPTELAPGIERLRAAGETVVVPEGIHDQWFLFPGDDATRADRFWQAACDPASDVIWAARGGYGATRLLPELERRTLEEGMPPRKLLCGYSDITALHEFVKSRWGWSSLHCCMPTGASFIELPQTEFEHTLSLVNRRLPDAPLTITTETLTPFGPDVLNDLEGTLVGGNLTLVAALAGTPFAIDNAGGRLMFFEDVSEAPYRIDRYLQQLHQAGVFRGVRAVILGTFADCADEPPTMGPAKTPVRPKLETADWMRYIWAEFSRATKIPVVATLPVGHGPEKAPLPLGAKYKLTGAGRLELLSWDWLRS